MANGKINKSTYVICNGFKRDQYIENITLINNGKNTIPIIDNYEELDLLQARNKGKFKINRIAAEEEPKFEFYYFSFRIGYKNR
jgi:arginine decarboxylase